MQSFGPCDAETDADVLAAATGEHADVVCPRHRWYAMAPASPLAAAFLGMAAPTLGKLVAEMERPAERIEGGAVETAGSPRSPVAPDGDSRALARAVEPDLIVLVAHAGLGAINEVRRARRSCPSPSWLFLNHFDRGDVHDRNLRWLQGHGVDVVVRIEELARRIARDSL